MTLEYFMRFAYFANLEILMYLCLFVCHVQGMDLIFQSLQ